MTTAEIIQSIDRRLEQIQREVDDLEGARTKLVNGADRPHRRQAQASRRTAPRTATNGKRARAKRRARRRAVSTADLERVLVENGALTTAALAAEAGVDRAQVLNLLKELEAEGRVRRLGARRATRWRVFSEEEAIAERAAELAARSRSAA